MVMSLRRSTKVTRWVALHLLRYGSDRVQSLSTKDLSDCEEPPFPVKSCLRVSDSNLFLEILEQLLVTCTSFLRLGSAAAGWWHFT
jgi:hypothetical protein